MTRRRILVLDTVDDADAAAVEERIYRPHTTAFISQIFRHTTRYSKYKKLKRLKIHPRVLVHFYRVSDFLDIYGIQSRVVQSKYI